MPSREVLLAVRADLFELMKQIQDPDVRVQLKVLRGALFRSREEQGAVFIVLHHHPELAAPIRDEVERHSALVTVMMRSQNVFHRMVLGIPESTGAEMAVSR